MKKFIATLFVLAVGLGLMIFSATGTMMLLQPLFPKMPELAYFALLAFDGGVIAWTLTFMFGAEGGPQRGIAGAMIVVDLLGVIVGFGANMELSAGSIGLVEIDPQMAQTALMLVIGVIALNIAATIFFHVLSIENRRKMQEEGFKDEIEEAAFKKSKAAIPNLAAQLADEMTNTRMAQLTSTYRAMMLRDVVAALPAPVAATDTTPRAEPTVLDKIKQRVSDVIAPASAADEMVTLASEGEAVPAPKVTGG